MCPSVSPQTSLQWQSADFPQFSHIFVWQAGRPTCSSVSPCLELRQSFLAPVPSSWNSPPSLSMKLYPGLPVGRPLRLAAWSIWLQTSGICSTLLPVAFPVFLCERGETPIGHAAVPGAPVAAGYASLASSANVKAGIFPVARWLGSCSVGAALGGSEQAATGTPGQTVCCSTQSERMSGQINTSRAQRVDSTVHFTRSLTNPASIQVHLSALNSKLQLKAGFSLC